MGKVMDEKYEKLSRPPMLPQFNTVASGVAYISFGLIILEIVSYSAYYLLGIKLVEDEQLLQSLTISAVILLIPTMCMFVFSVEPADPEFFEQYQGMSTYQVAQIIWCACIAVVFIFKSLQHSDNVSFVEYFPFLVFPPHFWIVPFVTFFCIGCFIFLNYYLKLVVSWGGK